MAFGQSEVLDDLALTLGAPGETPRLKDDEPNDR